MLPRGTDETKNPPIKPLSFMLFLAADRSRELNIHPSELLFSTKAVHQYINDMDYGNMENFLIMHLDSLDGVESSIEYDPIKFPTGWGLVRNAQNAKPLKLRLAPNSPILEIDNLLLRALSTLRGIDHTLQYKFDHTQDPRYKIARANLKNIFRELVITLTESGRDDYKKIQQEFNTQLIRVLHATSLDSNVKNAKGYSKLLSHYRDLAALIDPAKSMQTILLHKVGNSKVVITETAHPVTKKTDAQKLQLGVARELNEQPGKHTQNFHSGKNIAFQQANQAFYDYMIMDDRRLPAQSRKTIGPTVKNGYLTEIKLDFHKPNAEENSATYHSLRCGSIAYIGKDEHQGDLDNYAKENFHQLKGMAKGKVLHLTVLLTDTAINDQDVIIKVSKAAAEKVGVHYSNVPINLQGTIIGAAFSNINVAQIIQDRGSVRDPNFKHTKRLNRSERVIKAAEVINVAADNDMMNITMCASGQDRTGTAQEVASMLWMQQQYKNNGIDVTKESIEQLRAQGCHNAFLACLATPGSMGMKKESSSAYFSPETRAYYYRETAATNKEPLIDEPTISALMTSWSATPNKQKFEVMEEVYLTTLDKIESADTPEKIQLALSAWVKTALQFLSNTSGKIMDTLRFLKKTADPSMASFHETKIIRQLEYLNNALEQQLPLENILAAIKNPIITEKMLHQDETKLSPVFQQLTNLVDTASRRLANVSSNNSPDSKISRR